tara:strand:- start:4002 stop:4859 length:858 start_codon:yes stop_codon:yes gene_type:complete
MSKYIIPKPKKLYDVNIESLLSDFCDFKNKNLIFFDIETIGLSSYKDYEQILQISAWCVDGNSFEKKEEFDLKVKLSEATSFFLSGIDKTQMLNWKRRQKRRGSILNDPNNILKITNYHNLKISEKCEKESLYDFCNFIRKYENSILIAHNIDFDLKFITSRCKFHNIRFTTFNALDTLKISQFFFAPLVQTLSKTDSEFGMYMNTLVGLSKTHKHISSKLGHLAIALGHSSDNWHTASADVEMMFYVFTKIIKILRKYKNTDISFAQKNTIDKTQNKRKTLSRD